MVPILVIGIVALIMLVYTISVYNGLITLRNRTQEAWSDIEVQMKRRYDLIPNLVETVKGYAAHESGTLEKVIQARNMAMSVKPGDVKKAAESENILSGALKSIFALSENYPTLQANTNFLELQRELRDTEDKIQAARRFYNGNVLTLNTRIEQFPTNILALAFNFQRKDFFELDSAEAAQARQAVQVKF